MTERVRIIAKDAFDRYLFGVTPSGEHRLPGGKMAKGEDPRAAASRELQEETGLQGVFTPLFFLHDNHVFLCRSPTGTLTVDEDPDKEFETLEWIHEQDAIGLHMNEFAEAIFFRYLIGDWEVEGSLQVVDEDGKVVMELEDDVIWQTMPKLAQERARGKKFTYRQKLKDGTTVSLDAEALPAYMTKQRVRVMGLDTGLVTSRGNTLSKVTPSVADGIDIHWEDGTSEKLRWPQLGLDCMLLGAESISVSTHDPRQEAEAIAKELCEEHYPEEDYRPDVIVTHGGDYVAVTRHNASTGHTYIAVNSDYLLSPNLRQILAHEVVHYHLAKKHGRIEKDDAHNEAFMREAERINEVEGPEFIGPNADKTQWVQASNIV